MAHDMKPVREGPRLKARDLQAEIARVGLEGAIETIRAEDIEDRRLGQHWADAEILLSLIRGIVAAGEC